MEIEVYFDQLFVKSGSAFVCVQLQDILTLEASDHYIKIFTGYNNYHCARTQLKKMEASLSGYPFQRVHNSYIVNMKKIKQIEGNIIKLLEGVEVPLQKRYYAAFFQRIWLP